MRMYDIIAKKKAGKPLHDEEIKWVVQGFTSGRIPDYQMSALAMAICFTGMNSAETAVLTRAMADSGDCLDLAGIEGITVDKHSTGGVGDKTTIVAAPMLAACGLVVAKMSGRGLGFTGGTIDKLESIPGLRTDLSGEEFYRQVSDISIVLAGQSAVLAPADKKLYALRDVTATVDSLPLIASSIMSKKLAAGSRIIELDVKCGSGAFMPTLDSALELASAMVDIGRRSGRKTSAVVSDMSRPLGFAIGNALEVAEAVQTLKGGGPDDLRELCVALVGGALSVAYGIDEQEGEERALQSIHDGSAYAKLCEMVKAQGGDVCCLEDTERLPRAEIMAEVRSLEDGYITAMQANDVGVASMILGAGRDTKEAQIDFGAGILLQKQVGDRVQKGEVIARFYTSQETQLPSAEEQFRSALSFGQSPPPKTPLLLARVSEQGVEKF